jgi:hypothetical protein
MSLSKQATQIPMFAGFPHFCKSEAKTPIKAPTEMIPQRVAKKVLKVVTDQSSFPKNGLDLWELVTAKGQEREKGWAEKLRTQKG